MADQFSNYVSGLASPATHAAAVTPSDGTDLANAARGLYIGGAGDVTLVTVGGEEVTFAGVTAAAYVPVRTARVKATGTTATAIVALW